MSIFQREGIKALSQLEIDVDKNWETYGVRNLREITPGMVIGDLVARGSTVLTRIPTGPADWVLTSAGPGLMPVWRPPAAPFEPYFPVWLFTSYAWSPVTVTTRSLSLPSPTNEIEPQVTPTLGPQPSLGLDRSTVTPVTRTVTAPVTSPILAELFPDGAIAYYGNPPVEYDETTQARSEAINDVHLPPQNPRIPQDECLYAGHVYKFNRFTAVVTTKGIGNFSIDIQYWNGTTWATIPDTNDHLDDFQSLGNKWVAWSPPGDWELRTIGGYNLYWVRVYCPNMVSLTTAPLAQRIYLGVYERDYA